MKLSKYEQHTFITVLVAGLCSVLFQYFEATHNQRIHIYWEFTLLLRRTGRNKWQTLILPVSVVLSQPELPAKKTCTELFFFLAKIFILNTIIQDKNKTKTTCLLILPFNINTKYIMQIVLHIKFARGLRECQNQCTYLAKTSKILTKL